MGGREFESTSMQMVKKFMVRVCAIRSLYCYIRKSSVGDLKNGYQYIGTTENIAVTSLMRASDEMLVFFTSDKM